MPPQKAMYRELALAGALPLLFLLPFLNKAVHIDDPLFLWTARHLLTDPLNFYGFQVNWYGTEMPMYLVNQNPPLAAYYLALPGSLSGWNEASLRLAMALPAMAAGVGTYLVALRCCRQPLAAALAAIATPAFVVSSTTLMSDMLLLAFYVWSIHCWMLGLERKRYRWLVLAGLLAAAAALSKYFGASVLLLLGAYTLAKGRSSLRALPFLALPVFLLLAYEALTAGLYGTGLFTDAARYARAMRGETAEGPGVNVLVGLSFAGGCLATVLFYAGRLCSRLILAIGAALALLTGVEAFRVLFPGVSPALAMQFGLWTVAGGGIVLLALTDWRHARTPESLLLVLWILGTLFFALFLNHFANARVLLPMAPAVGMLIVRRIEWRHACDAIRPRPVPAWPLAPAAALALAAGFADLSLANAGRDAAREIAAQPRGAGLWFSGHWGFQYYMEQAGGVAIDVERPGFAPGDLFVMPENNTNPVSVPETIVAERFVLDFATLPWMTTMQRHLGAGFYSDLWGPVPFLFAPVPPERYTVVRLGPPEDPH